jgi:hypothetical protein
MANRQHYARFDPERSDEDLDEIMDEFDETEPDSFSDYNPDRFKRRQINRALAKLATGSYEEALIQVLIESPDALPLSVRIKTIDRSCERVGDVGLRLDEAKEILHGLQEHLVRQQLSGYLDAHRPCPDCHRLRAIKGHHPLRFRSAFGDINLRSPRWCRCGCEKRPTNATPFTVGLDGGYIRGRERRPGGTGCFEVIAGKSIPEDGPSKVFAGVHPIRSRSVDCTKCSGPKGCCRGNTSLICPMAAIQFENYPPTYTRIASIFWTGFISQCALNSSRRRREDFTAPMIA